MKSRNVFSFSNPLNWTENQTVSETIRRTQILSLLRTLSISAHYIPGLKGISSCYYGSFVCSDTSIIGINFWPLSSSEQIPLVLPDYFILENNSLLKMALKYKRIQLTDFRTVPMEHFGENDGFGFFTFTVNHRYIYGAIFYMENILLFFYHRFTFEDLLPTGLLWFPSLRTAVAGVSTTEHVTTADHMITLFLFWHKIIYLIEPLLNALMQQEYRTHWMCEAPVGINPLTPWQYWHLHTN